MLSPTERRLRAQIAAHEMHARHDPVATTATARKVAAEKLDKRLLRHIDPNGALAETERARRLEHARKAHFARLALRSVKKRRRAQAAKKAAPR